MSISKMIFQITMCISALAIVTSSEFKTCSRSDPKFSECMTGAFKQSFLAIAHGYKPKGVAPVEPLAVKNMRSTTAMGILKIDQKLKNCVLSGLTEGVEGGNFNVDFQNNVFTSEIYNPHVDLVGNYNLLGSILAWSIKGTGKTVISMYELRSKHRIKFDTFEKNGEIFMHVTGYEVKFFPKRVKLWYEHLENDPGFLAQQIKNFVDTKSKWLFKQMKASYEEIIGSEFARITNELFNDVPLNQIFPL